jgi:hypothetical protein
LSTSPAEEKIKEEELIAEKERKKEGEESNRKYD